MTQQQSKALLTNIALVSLGPIFASILSFLAEPWIARLWEPAVYGVGSYFNSMLQLLTPILFLRYNFALVQAKNEKEEANLLALSLLIMLIFLILIAVCYPLFDLMSKGRIQFSRYEFLFMAAVVMGSLSLLLRFWSSAKKRFMHISISTMILSLSYVVLLLVFGYMGKTNEEAMIKIRAVSYIMYPLLMLIDFVTRDLRKWMRNISMRGIVEAAKAYKDYPLHEYAGFVANILAFNLPVILIARYWGNEITGLYAKAFTLLYMFVLILGDSVNRVFHKEVADMINVGRDISTFVKQITLSIVSLSIVPFTMIVVAGPEIFNIFLGQRWLMSGVFAQAMAIWSFSNLLYLSILPLYGVLNKQKQYTRFTITTLALRAGIIIVMGASNMDVVLTLYVFSIANFVVLIWQFMYILHVSGIEYRWTMSKVFGKIAQVLPMVAILFLIRYLWVVDQKMYLSLALVASSPYVYMYYIRDTKDIRRIFYKKPM